MELKHHEFVTRKAVAEYFDDLALRQIIAANLGQDALQNQFGNTPQFHFDDNKIAEGLAYVDEQHAIIIKLATDVTSGATQRAAFGRLCHAVQDFYSHSNYVDLWLEANGGLAATTPDQMNGLDTTLQNHPQLHSGKFNIWHDFMYYVPGLKHLVRAIDLPPDSHEAMNLDSPKKGPKFEYSLVAACQRTKYEYEHAAQGLLEIGGQAILARFQHVELE